jgi:hypothetical protein
MNRVASKGKVSTRADSQAGPRPAVHSAQYYLTWCLACCVGSALAGLVFTKVSDVLGHPAWSRWLTEPGTLPDRGSTSPAPRAPHSAQYYLNWCAASCAGIVFSALAFTRISATVGHPEWARWLTAPMTLAASAHRPG